MFEAIGCFCQYFLCQELRPPLTEDGNQGIKKQRELDKLRKKCKQEKGYCVFEMYECDWWNMYKTDNIAIQHLRESCPYKMPLREERFLENIKSLFNYVQFMYIEVPEELREAFANFPTIFKSINVGRGEIRPLLKEYGEKEGF